MTAPDPAVPPDQQGKNTGSPKASEPVFLLVGRFRGAHGVKGEITMEVLTDFPQRLRPNRTVYVGEDHRPLRIHATRWKDHWLLVSFEGIGDRNEAALLRNQPVYVRAEESPPLADGEYYYHQLIGLNVIEESGNRIGVLSEILETGANDVFVVKPEHEPEILLPVIESVILKVDLDAGQIIVKPQTWD